jgi:hypothetical protein
MLGLMYSRLLIMGDGPLSPELEGLYDVSVCRERSFYRLLGEKW